MDSVIEWFNSFSGFLASIVEFAVGLVRDMISLVRLLGQAVAKVPDILAVLPPSVTALLLVALSVAVLYKVLGREG